ncbi:hypothetical protein [Gordonia soli]|uniref:Uncharacterized protein n=1 Tax=Gordonia soli NBRC 108243 TaxID=1223545 RepID=M0QN08_9ACTN|nr:hypothetical protein [Gordonia soli]GAC69948.1 hypothetical protein GS4_30_00190 [Gordonia soli NBRC 108243]
MTEQPRDVDQTDVSELVDDLERRHVSTPDTGADHVTDPSSDSRRQADGTADDDAETDEPPD